MGFNAAFVAYLQSYSLLYN